MKRYNFDEYISSNLPVFCIQRAKIKSTGRGRRKPRDEAEWQVFFILTEYKMNRWIKEGKFQKITPRRFKLNLDITQRT